MPFHSSRYQPNELYVYIYMYIFFIFVYIYIFYISILSIHIYYIYVLYLKKYMCLEYILNILCFPVLWRRS